MTVQDIHDRYREISKSIPFEIKEKYSLALIEQWHNWKAVSTAIMYFPNGLRGGIKYQGVFLHEVDEHGHLNEELAKDFDFYFSELEDFLKGKEDVKND